MLKTHRAILSFTLLMIFLLSSILSKSQDPSPESPSPSALAMTEPYSETPTASPSETPTSTPTASETVELILTPSYTEIAATVDIISPLETTTDIEVSPSSFLDHTLTAPTGEATYTPTAHLTPFETTTPEITETVETVLTTASTASETATSSLVPFPLRLVVGTAQYQSRVTNHLGIEIIILDANRNLVASSTTNSDGAYEVAVPVEDFFWLIVQSPLHRRFELGIWPEETLPVVILAGGDIDRDGCINAIDLALLTTEFGITNSTTDITGDGLTDASDLAVLAGNYAPEDCLANSLIIPSPTLESFENNHPSQGLVEITDDPNALFTPESTNELEGSE